MTRKKATVVKHKLYSGRRRVYFIIVHCVQVGKNIKSQLIGVLKSTSQPGLELILVKQQLNKTKSLTHVLLHNNLQIIHRFCSWFTSDICLGLYIVEVDQEIEFLGCPYMTHTKCDPFGSKIKFKGQLPAHIVKRNALRRRKVRSVSC